MRAYTTIRGPDGREHELVPGDVVGRLHTAALSIDDGRVSEAHAMVSLRDGALRLLALRGVFALDGRRVEEAVLQPGLVVTLAPGVAVEVLDVWLPEAVLGVAEPLRPLPPVCSLVDGRLRVGWKEGATAHIWSTGGGWRVRDDRGTRPLAPGDTVGSLQIVTLPLQDTAPTRQDGLAAPLHLVAHYDSLHVHRRNRLVLTLSGVLARMVCELVLLDGPVAWTLLAAEVWPDADDPQLARMRLDANLARLRAKLRAAGLRTDLVQPTGAGLIELRLQPGNTVEDRT
ncbi:MAG: hypothetical protein GY913_04650 [Proteobacteria bacterium]|nr:hypothetical protein [Pseudomonadota bacterium]MCP4916190.1 hypothetical protein [Pseudomonadota bacterium]